jgi:hypothetical protein
VAAAVAAAALHWWRGGKAVRRGQNGEQLGNVDVPAAHKLRTA